MNDSNILSTSDPLQSILGLFRIICMKELDIDGEILKYGDLIYDSKNSEYGIFLGIKPLNIGDNPIRLNTQLENLVRKPKKSIGIFLTLSIKNDQDDLPPIIAEESTDSDSTYYISRVRYTELSSIKKITRSSDKFNSMGDLDRYCKKVCFMDCSKDCPLWKYGHWKP